MGKKIGKLDFTGKDTQTRIGRHPPEAGTALPQKQFFLSRQSVQARCKHPTVLPSDDNKGPS